MSTPYYAVSLGAALSEICSAQSALHSRPEPAENPNGDYLSQRDLMAKHSVEHMRCAFRIINAVLNEKISRLHTHLIKAFRESNSYHIEKALDIIQEIRTGDRQPDDHRDCEPKADDKFEELKSLANNLFEALDHADFRNGVEAYGIDEGEVRARELIEGYRKEYRRITGQKVGGCDNDKS